MEFFDGGNKLGFNLPINNSYLWGAPNTMESQGIQKSLEDPIYNTSIASTSNLQLDNAKEIEKKKKEKELSLAGLFYGQNKLGYLSPYAFNTSGYFNSLGRGIENMGYSNPDNPALQEQKRSAGSGQLVAGLIGGGLSIFRDTMAGTGAQNIENFMNQEGMRKYLEASNTIQGIDRLNNQGGMGSSPMFEDGGEMMQSPQEEMAENQQVEQAEQPTQQQAENPEMEMLQAYAQSKGYNQEQFVQLVQMISELTPEEKNTVFQDIANQIQ